MSKSETDESTAKTEKVFSSASGSGSSGDCDATDFECNICFELAQDPIVTLCGHLYCWPCLFRWLRLHSHSHECPVCKALIQEEKLVPLFGRGGSVTDPRTKPIPGVEIPPPQDSTNLSNFGLGLWGGFLPVVTAGFGNFAMLAGFGGILPSMLSFQIQGFAPPIYDTSFGYPGGNYHGSNVHRAPEASQGEEAEDNKLVLILVLVFLAAAFCLLPGM